MKMNEKKMSGRERGKTKYRKKVTETGEKGE